MSKIINFRKETLKNKAIKLGLQIKPNGNFVPTEGLGLTDLLVTRIPDRPNAAHMFSQCDKTGASKAMCPNRGKVKM